MQTGRYHPSRSVDFGEFEKRIFWHSSSRRRKSRMRLSDVPLTCPKCSGPTTLRKAEPPHFKRLDCDTCGFIDWVQNPDRERYRRPSAEERSAVRSVREKSKRCALCGITPKWLEIHHSLAVCDGGPVADLSNLIPLCRDCHEIGTTMQRVRRDKVR